MNAGIFRSGGSDGLILLQSLRIPATLHIAVLAPHPDDFDAIGITMRWFRDNGNPIDLAVLTSGASGVEDEFLADPSQANKGAAREEEQRASCHFFGLPESSLTFLHLTEDHDGHPLENDHNKKLISTFLKRMQPDIVLLPHGNDTNPGHRRTYVLFRSIVEEERLSLLALLNRDPKTIAMRQDLFVPFSEEGARWKAELLRFHQSQHQRNLRTRKMGFDERILRANRRTGTSLPGGAPYAEVFEVQDFSNEPDAPAGVSRN